MVQYDRIQNQFIELHAMSPSAFNRSEYIYLCLAVRSANMKYT